MKTKKCPKCGIEKPLTAEYYHRDKYIFTGFKSYCKACVKKYYQDNKEKKAEHRSRPENKEKKKKYNAEHYQDNKEKLLKKNAEYRKNNKEKIAQMSAEYYSKNREEILEKQSEYHKNNREKIAQKKSEYHSRPEVKEKTAKYNAKYNSERNAEQPACVYQIVNTVNNKVYIGQTMRGDLRWKDHLYTLRNDITGKRNHKLQADFNKFGEDAFEWSIIKEYPKDKKLLESKEKTTD
jgi:hypothetical protein